MKNFKIKYFVVLISSILLLLSCQTETVVSDAVAISTKKVPLPDGLPSAADDVYAFETSQYYLKGKLITDTIVIKDLLKDCKLLFVDGNRKEIYKTNQEAERFKTVSNNNNINNRGTAALDGDDFIQFYFEIKHTYTNAPIYDGLFLFSILGPQSRFSNIRMEVTHLTQYPNQEPVFVNTTVRATNWSFYMDSAPGQDVRYTVNVINTSRYRRSLTILSDDGRNITLNIHPGVPIAMNGRNLRGGADRNFYGNSGFRIKSYSSDKNIASQSPFPPM